MIEEHMVLKGHVRFDQYDEHGVLKLVRHIDNLILDDGLEIACELLGGTGSQTQIIGVAIGTSSAAVVASQTDLQGSELDREVTVESFISGTPPKERFTVTFDAGEGTGTIEEAVLIDTDAASGARKCFSRVLTGTITKGAGDSLTVTWDIFFDRQ